jgi:hypothetical protein
MERNGAGAASFFSQKIFLNYEYIIRFRLVSFSFFAILKIFSCSKRRRGHQNRAMASLFLHLGPRVQVKVIG